MENDHEHDWLVQFYSFDPIEHDEPYVVLYCADAVCAQRMTRVMTSEEIERERSQQGYTPYVASGWQQNAEVAA